MSRSYRKFAVIKDRCRHSNDFMKPKTKANRMVRRTKDVPQHSGFKKVYCSWNISDYKFIGVQSETELRSGWLKNDITSSMLLCFRQCKDIGFNLRVKER